MSDDTTARVREALERGSPDAAAELAIREWGPQILGYLHSIARDAPLADDAFALWCENVWKHVGAVDTTRGSLRAWCYVVARNALARLREAESKHQRRRAGIGSSALDRIAEEVRASTLRYLPDSAESAIARLRESLDPEERELLGLRVDRGLAFLEIASIVAPDEEPSRAAARLRKKLERVTLRLRELARQAGLLG